MSVKEIFSKLSATKKLPTPSRVALEVMRLCHSESTHLSDIAKVIQTDPALTAELIKYANSAAINTGIPVVSIEKATVKLGMQTIVNLALSFSILSHNKKGRCLAFDYNVFWSTSLARAISMKTLSQHLNDYDEAEMFTCGLLGQIGKLALASLFPEEYDDILNKQHSTKILKEYEKEHFGISNNELTTELFYEWGLPSHYASMVLDHEDYQPVKDDSSAHLTRFMHLADQIANLCQLTYALPKKLGEIEKLASHYDINAQEVGTIFDSIVTKWQEWGELYKIPTQDCPLYHEIKAQELTSKKLPKNSADQLKVLVVDDDPLTLMNLTRIFEEKGYSVTSAENGAEGLQIALEFQPHLLITDLRMPKMDGLEFCSILRSTASTKHIYIIMLTACEHEDDVIQAFDAGADDYVVKPFSPKVLEARLRSCERLVKYQKMLSRDREVIQKYATKLSAANQKLKSMAMTDALTELPNRRYAMNRMKEVLAEAARHHEPLSCIMIDLDHFKQINDTYGHHAGDTVLKEIALILKNGARNHDNVCRMGGEEFLIISNRNNSKTTKALAERLRKKLEEHSITVNNESIKITASFGIAEWNEKMKEGDDLIRAADRALYLAKNKGRNRVECG